MDDFTHHNCNYQCDNCHDIDNCVQATRRLGDLLLCEDCYKLESAMDKLRTEEFENDVRAFSSESPGLSEKRVRELIQFLGKMRDNSLTRSLSETASEEFKSRCQGSAEAYDRTAQLLFELL